MNYSEHLLPCLSERTSELELMDKPETSAELLINTLRHFEVINRWLSSHRRLLNRYIIADMLKNNRQSRRLLDLGAGGCDIAIWLVKTCRWRGLKLSIVCIDHDSRVVDYARTQTSEFPEIEVVCGDALKIDECGERFDYVFANRVLHHLTSAEIQIMLKKIHIVCGRIFIINDLLRCYSSYLIFSMIASIFFHHSFVYEDGRLSIKKGFTLKELCQMVNSNSLNRQAIVGTAFPGHIYAVGYC